MMRNGSWPSALGSRMALGWQPRVSSRLREENGVALIIAMMTVLLMTALGVALMMMTMTEGRISSNYSGGNEALYAADAAIERVMQDLLTVPDWNKILDGTTTSAFIDGAAGGNRTLPDGATLNLTEATNVVRCGKLVCADTDITAYTDERPWGPNNPKWQLYAYGPMEEMITTGTINSLMYVVVWVGDDPAENDNDPLHDGTTDTNLGRNTLALLAHAYGPDGVKRVIEVTVSRTDTTEIERGYTGQRGQDEQNRRARKAAVQTPGKALTRSDMTIASGGLVKQ